MNLSAECPKLPMFVTYAHSFLDLFNALISIFTKNNISGLVCHFFISFYLGGNSPPKWLILTLAYLPSMVSEPFIKSPVSF